MPVSSVTSFPNNVCETASVLYYDSYVQHCRTSATVPVENPEINLSETLFCFY